MKKVRGRPKRDSPLVVTCEMGGGVVKPKIVRVGLKENCRKILKLRQCKDSGGMPYYPACILGGHRGLHLKGEEVYIKRRCKHYKAAYLFDVDFDTL